MGLADRCKQANDQCVFFLAIINRFLRLHRHLVNLRNDILIIERQENHRRKTGHESSGQSQFRD